VTVRCGDRWFTAIQGVLFDKDGTLAQVEIFLARLAALRWRCLVDLVPVAAEWRSWFEAGFGIDRQGVAPDGLLAIASRRDNEIAAAAYLTALGLCWPEALRAVQIAFVRADRLLLTDESGSLAWVKAEQTPALEDGINLLKWCWSLGLRVGVLSSDTIDAVEAFCNRYCPAVTLHLAWGADATNFKKPDPALFAQACQVLGCSPARVLMVGDATSDMAMAKAAGAAGTIGVTWGWQRVPVIQDADALLSSLGGFEILERSTPI